MVPALTQALQDNDPGVRLAAVNALHVVTPDDPQAREAAAALLATLRDADPRVRAQAAGILSTLKPDPKLALPQLITAALPEADAPVASSPPAAAATGSVTARDLIDRSQRDHARASAVAALGVVGAHDPEVQKTLVALADDAAPEVRMVVARVLGEIGPEAAGAFAAVMQAELRPRSVHSSKSHHRSRQLSRRSCRLVPALVPGLPVQAAAAPGGAELLIGKNHQIEAIQCVLGG